MLKLSILSAILVAFLATFVIAKDPEKRKPVNWQPILTLKFPGMKAYINSNSLTTTKSEDGTDEFNSAELLMTFDKEIEVTVGQIGRAHV